MKKQFHTKDGIIDRELTENEIQEFAEMGDRNCQLELAKEESKKALSIEEQLIIIERYLGLS